MTFKDVREAAADLKDVSVSSYYGKPALKTGGTMFVCMASHRSAEPNSLVVRMPMDQRDVVLADQPAIYYVTDHYVDYPSVLVRLSRVTGVALRDLVTGAHRYVSRGRAAGRRRR